MLKIFRKIRYDLMGENKTGRYLKYAIGEIILVVIGILIALQINNAKEDRKTNSIKQNYYHQIAVDLDKEIENIKARIAFLDSSITTSEKYFKFIETPNLEMTEILRELTNVELSFRYLAFNTNTIQTLEATGDIKLIPEGIRNALIELKREQDRVSSVAAGNYDIYLTANQKALQLGFVRFYFNIPKVNDLAIENNIPEIILTFEGGLLLKDFTDNLVRKSLEEMLKEISYLKERIDLEIKES